MAVIEYPQNTCCETEHTNQRPRRTWLGRLSAAFVWLYERHKRRASREHFRDLCGREEWIYRDLGVSRADVEWAARLPLHVDAGCEIDRIRDRARMGR